MKTYHKILLVLALNFTWCSAFSQTTKDAEKLVKEGIAANDSGKYDNAVAKYSQALKIDPKCQDAYYEMAYTLFTSGKERDALRFLDKLVELNPSSAQAFDMLGSIYDDLKEPDKAVDYYQKGIKADSTYQRLYFNLAITYYGQGKYAESERCSIKAIKLNPKHASSQRVYAMATYKQQKRGCSLMAWCAFLIQEPQSKRSPGAFAYIKNIINYGINKKDEKNINITISPDGDTAPLLMPLAVIAATENKKDLSNLDSLQLQLTSLFNIANTIADDKTQKFASGFYADYFEKLAKSGNMPAFARFISISVYKDENLAWFKEHDKEFTELDKWISATPRNF